MLTVERVTFAKLVSVSACCISSLHNEAQYARNSCLVGLDRSIKRMADVRLFLSLDRTDENSSSDKGWKPGIVDALIFWFETNFEPH